MEEILPGDKLPDGTVWDGKDYTDMGNLTDSNVNNLVGRLLTVVDATFSDKDQRKAFKDIVMREIWEWRGYVVGTHDRVISAPTQY